jgi:shikimate kinase
VIALGGGTVLLPDHVEKLRKMGQLIYLEARPETLRKRILRADILPAFLQGEDELDSLISLRKPIYESIQARRIAIDALDDNAVLAALRSILILEGIEG